MVRGIYYGMLEANREFDERRTPVVDLGPLFKISQWIKGVYDFNAYGNGYMIANLLDDQEAAGKMKNISELVNINYINDLKQEVDSLDNYLKETMSHLPVLKYMAPYIEDFVKRFRGANSNSVFQFRLARWYYENRRYANSYICLSESIITRVLEVYKAVGVRIYNNKRDRDKIKRVIYNQFENQPSNSVYRQLYDVYYAISDIRNRIAHAGFKDRSSFKKDIKNMEACLRTVEKLFFRKELQRAPVEFPLDTVV